MFRRSGKGFKVAVVVTAVLLWAALPAAAAPARVAGEPGALWIEAWEGVLGWIVQGLGWQDSSLTAGWASSACSDSSSSIDPNGCPNAAQSDSSAGIDPNGHQ